MTIRRFIGICVKSVIFPLLAIFAVHRFNVFVGFNQITDDQAFFSRLSSPFLKASSKIRRQILL